MKKTLLLFFCGAFICSASLAQPVNMHAFIKELMSRMTLQEKIGQLNLQGGWWAPGGGLDTAYARKVKSGQIGASFNIPQPEKNARLLQDLTMQSRLKIPLLIGGDVVQGYKTIFPIPLAETMSWNLKGMGKSASITASEASTQGIAWTFAPMIDISRDPRWGRVSEGVGEDPYLGSLVAAARVKGFQGSNYLQSKNMMACMKHFAMYGAPEAGKDYTAMDMSKRVMYDVYLKTYKAAVEAGVGSVMSSFNDVQGEPASGSKWLLTDVLRNQWKFKGLVISDYTSIEEMKNHGIVATDSDASALSINAGIDMDMVSELYSKNIEQLVKSGRIHQKEIDRAVYNVLAAKYMLGLFENRYRYCDDDRAAKELMSEQHLQHALQIAQESIVLLKNDKQTLPLKASGTIALIGPFAKTEGVQNIGATEAARPVSIYEALSAQLKNKATVLYAKGANISENDMLMQRIYQKKDSLSAEALKNEAVSIARKADVIIAVMGEHGSMGGEAASMANIELQENQRDLLKALKALNKPMILVLKNNRPLIIGWESENIDAIIDAWYLGTKEADAIVNVLLGKYNPSAKLTMTFPRSVGQIPIYYAHNNSSRPEQEGNKYTSKYLDISSEPLYPFGFGLSYTSFDYSPVTLSAGTLIKTGKLTATITLKNSGQYDGAEVVQLYIQDVVGSIKRPVRELKGFEKIFLKAGESRTVSFTITEDMLRFYNNELIYRSEPGKFKVFIGTNSDTKNEASFELK